MKRPGGRPPRDRLLMCRPTGYDLLYEINPWMSVRQRPDLALAARQWDHLHELLTGRLGLPVELVEQAEGWPDMVFTANAGLVSGKTVAMSRFRHPERQGETAHFAAWFEGQGYELAYPPERISFEGEGDALFAGETLLAGYRIRSEIGSHRFLSEVFSCPVLSLELVDKRWYHLDTCLFVLDPGTVVAHPGAFDAYGRRALLARYEVIEVEEDEALRFACNTLVLGRDLVMPDGCPKLASALAKRGYVVHPVPMSEFLKAGGAVKCLSLWI